MGFRNPLTSISGSQITPGTIIGSTVETAASGERVVLTGSGLVVGQPEIDLFTGDAGEIRRGRITMGVTAGGGIAAQQQGFVQIDTPDLGGGYNTIFMKGASRDASQAASMSVGGLQVAGVATLNSDLSVAGNTSIQNPATLWNEPWKAAPAFANSWSNYNTSAFRGAGYRKMLDGTVMLRGLVAGGTLLVPMFTLPAGYRPGAEEIFVCWADLGVAEITVDTSGNVVVQRYAGGDNYDMSLSGIRFSCID